MINILDLGGNIPGEFLLVFDQLVDEILQLHDQID